MSEQRVFQPHPYQLEAIRWIESRRRCCLFLDMGLGKTVVTLTAMQRLADRLEVNRVLIVAPRKVADTTWQDEAAKWSHIGLRVVTVMGTPAQRRRQLLGGGDVFVIGRDSLAWLADELAKTPRWFDMIVLDELTSFKNRSSLRWRAARALCEKADYVVGLTGTPTPQGLVDLWAQIFIIDGGERLGRTLTGYRARWFNTIERNHVIIKIWPKDGAEGEIRARIADICLTMLSDDHNPLPPLRTEDVAVTLPDDVMEGYRRFQRERLMELPEGKVTAANAAVLMGKLQQYTGGAVYVGDGTQEWTVMHTAKLAALARLLRPGAATMVFYQFRHEERRIMFYLRAMGLRVRTYEGAADLRAWNAGGLDVLLAHPASTAYGLNLQRGGHRMVWYSTGWSLEQYEQAVARLHRQGQEFEVECYRLVCPGTVDEAVIAALGRKQSGQRTLMEALSALRRIDGKTPTASV